MKIRMDSILPTPSDKRIREFEEYCGVSLPIEYKEFVKKYNGAVPETNVFNSNGKEYLIERFLCLMENPEADDISGWYDIEVVLSQIDTRLTDDENLIGANVIPIAALFAGDFVCLDFRKSDIPSVVIWFHEESDELSPFTIKIADNISEFLDMLKE